MAFFIALILYGIILITFSVFCFFIIYHMAKYSINASLNRVMLPFFILISIILIFSNVALFFAVDWNDLFSNFIIL